MEHWDPGETTACVHSGVRVFPEHNHTERPGLTHLMPATLCSEQAGIMIGSVPVELGLSQRHEKINGS